MSDAIATPSRSHVRSARPRPGSERLFCWMFRLILPVMLVLNGLLFCWTWPDGTTSIGLSLFGDAPLAIALAALALWTWQVWDRQTWNCNSEN
jgi:hypothetical protein